MLNCPKRVGILALICCNQIGCAAAEEFISADDWLNRQPQPQFRAGHTLPPLTRYGWSLPFETRRTLAEKWGYALEFESYATGAVVREALSQPNSPAGQALKLAVQEPQKYKLSIILPNDMPPYDLTGAWVRKADGSMPDSNHPMWSPAAPESVLDVLVKERTDPIGPLVDVVKPAVILNGGEYGISVLGFGLSQWKQDATVLAAKGSREWFDYISEMKAKEQKKILDAVRSRVGADFLYVYYTNGAGVHRERTGHWQSWTYDYAYMRKVGTLPSDEYYYRSFNDGWQRSAIRLPTQYGDLLTQVLNAKGVEIAGGDPFSYDWVTAGWHRKPDDDIYIKDGHPEQASEYLSRIDIYTGFLRCLYVAGTVGANAGYYAFPKGGFSQKFAADAPPHWLLQLAALGYVHALFSHLEPFVKNSYLLPGADRHVWASHPAYEFPTGENNLRVLVRKHNSLPAWLLIAWSATGDVRRGAVDIPGRGRVDVTGEGRGRLFLFGRDGPGEEITEQSVSMLIARHPELFAPQ